MASPSEDALVQSPISTEERVGLLPSHADTLSTDVELPSKSDMPPLLKHVYIL
jgi:hypothetical protein